MIRTRWIATLVTGEEVSILAETEATAKWWIEYTRGREVVEIREAQTDLFGGSDRSSPP